MSRLLKDQKLKVIMRLLQNIKVQSYRSYVILVVSLFIMLVFIDNFIEIGYDKIIIFPKKKFNQT